MEVLRPKPRFRWVKNDGKNWRKWEFCKISILPCGIVVTDVSLCLLSGSVIFPFFLISFGSSKTWLEVQRKRLRVISKLRRLHLIVWSRKMLFRAVAKCACSWNRSIDWIDFWCLKTKSSLDCPPPLKKQTNKQANVSNKRLKKLLDL